MFLVCKALGRGPVLWIWRFLKGIVYTLNAHTIHWSNWAIKQYVGVQRHMSDLQDLARCDYGRVDTGGWSSGLRCCICA